MLDRLPTWIKAAKHRGSVLKAIEHLRCQLSQTAPGTQSSTGLERLAAPLGDLP
jgi:hypothetical protein